MIVTVHTDETGERIDVLLAKRLELSRAHIQKLIKADRVFINDKLTDAHRRVIEGEKIVVLDQETPNNSTLNNLLTCQPLEILYEDADMLVINKPAGLLVHPNESSKGIPTLIDALLAHDPNIANVGENSMRPGIVHRLDKAVSGIMVVAKTADAFQFIKSQFQTRTVYKEYLALVYGSLPKEHDVIELKIARSKARGCMVARSGAQEGKDAKTEYEVIHRYKNQTYTRVILHTGRTHQIRVHFHAIDHSIVGDMLYKKSRMKNIRPIELDRLFLHAHKLRIQLMNGNEKTFESPLPEELKNIMDQLS